MSGLVLKLAPNERIMINGAVVENGERRTRLSIQTPNTNILRLKDAVHPDDATTPVSRACYQCQLILSGDINLHEGQRILARSIEELSQVFCDHDSRRLLDAAGSAAINGDAYAALRELRRLLPREARLFAVRQ
ncbi:flagellar biosynthesis repressor FlbT [Paracoccus jiaweipingae]|uniref:flagellar biosynthesis repressor FlbT n=1 Tax=unclassified Paracoccus (in: a-proteobacteria) TaxID=2688777 RepID=UPI0037B0B9D8